MVYKKSIKFLIVCFFSVYTNVALSNNQIYFVDINFLMNNSLAGKSIIKQLDEKTKNMITEGAAHYVHSNHQYTKELKQIG